MPLLGISMKVAQKLLALGEFIKSKHVDENQIKSSAQNILEAAKKVEGFIGGGWSSEEVLLNRLEDKLRTTGVAHTAYFYFSLIIVFPILYIGMGLLYGILNSMILFLLSSLVFTLWSCIETVIILRLK